MTEEVYPDMRAIDRSRQGTFELGDDAPPPSLLEDPDVELGDLATVPYVERPCPTCDGARWGYVDDVIHPVPCPDCNPRGE